MRDSKQSFNNSLKNYNSLTKVSLFSHKSTVFDLIRVSSIHYNNKMLLNNSIHLTEQGTYTMKMRYTTWFYCLTKDVKLLLPMLT